MTAVHVSRSLAKKSTAH